MSRQTQYQRKATAKSINLHTLYRTYSHKSSFLLVPAIAVVGIMALVSAFFLISDFSANSYAIDDPNDDMIDDQHYVSLSVSDANLSFTPSGSSTVNSKQVNITLSTNVPTGAKLYLSTADNTNALYKDGNTSSSSPTIKPTSTTTTLASMPVNSWGYSLNNATYQAVPTANSAALIANVDDSSVGTTSGGVVSATIPVYYGAKVDSSLPAGTYSNKVVYAAIGTIPISISSVTERVKANKGSSGVDGNGIEDIEKIGIEKYLTDIKAELTDGRYKPSPVKRVMIPKADGSERPLGIPTVKDRIVQMATKIAIEPVFEADFKDCSYGFRPKRSAKQALEKVRKACNNKGYYVVDAEIEKFFDNVNQDKLMVLVEQRISDRRIQKLIRQWLKSGVLYGNILTISELGTSQGSVISPLLANIYLNTLDRLWEKYGLTHGILVRYADDTVIICKNKKSANHALNLLSYIMAKLDLKLHPKKTKIVSMWDGKEGFDFLGMHHRRMTTETSKGQLYKETYQYPSRKAMKKMKAEIKKNVNSRSLLVAKEEDLIKNLNPKITGWKNYYSTKTNERWMQTLDWYIICTFTRWYNKKHQRRNHMSKVGFVRNSIYEKGLKKMARA